LDIIKLTNEKSINLFAEGMLNLVGFEQNSFGSTTSGIRAVYENFQGKINLRGMKLKDGSGLSRKNAVSAQNFIDLLSYINRSPLNDTFRSSLAVAGESGTLKNICRSQAASGRMFAKSGTLSNVKAYAGFVNTITGKRLAFAIIVNNFEGPRYQMVKKMERIFNAMASY
jgi:D-alanyl-D-alanine carboxypeptidase/D-alanyl-D-alanine-endopeptidase (penicillin-binding protein 4)